MYQIYADIYIPYFEACVVYVNCETVESPYIWPQGLFLPKFVVVSYREYHWQILVWSGPFPSAVN